MRRSHGAAETVVHGGLEAPHVFHGKVVRVTRLQVLVQHGKDLVVENLELAHTVHHALQGLQQSTQPSTKHARLRHKNCLYCFLKKELRPGQGSRVMVMPERSILKYMLNRGHTG